MRVIYVTFLIIYCNVLHAQKSVTWKDLVNVIINGNDLVNTSSAGWAGGAASVDILNFSIDGWVQTTVGERDKARMIGLSDTNINSHYTTIDYALYLRHSGAIQVYENGVPVVTSGPVYYTGDRVKVERVNGTVHYKKNEVIFYTSTIATSNPLIVDVSFSHQGATLKDITISDSFTAAKNNSTAWRYDNGATHIIGPIAVGTTTPDAKLTVKGDIHAEEVTVDLSVPGPDYVFEDDYELTTLKETESYIKANKHLPEIPSAKEMEEKGIDLGEMNMLLLKKIEELTLHQIELLKRIESLEKK